jgi:hypothetical protein
MREMKRRAFLSGSIMAMLGVTEYRSEGLRKRGGFMGVNVKRTYEGESRNGILQEALNTALRRLDADLGEGGVRDGMASWVVTEISGERGGIAAFHGVKVKITALRTPKW